MTARPAEPAPRPLVACLCAAWCGACRDYRATFDSLAGRFAADAEFAWIDVEDQADALGDLDIADFPTLCIVAVDATLFLGPVMPQAGHAERLLRCALAGELGAGDPALAELARRVRALAASQRAGAA